MAAPTYNQGVTLIKAAVNRLQKIELFANSASPNFDDLNDTLLAANLFDNQGLVAADADAMRAQLSAMLSPEAVRRAIRGAMIEWAIACGAPEGAGISLAQALVRIRDYAVANSKSLDARNFTRGAASAGGSNVGNGLVRRVTVDEDGFALEGSHAEIKTLNCVSDQAQVQKHKEVFEVLGATAEKDFIEVLGSGIVSGDGSTPYLTCLTTDDTKPYLANPTFSTYSGTAPTAGVESTPSAVTSITNWTLNNTAGARVSVDVVYRDLVTESLRYSVKFTADNTISQTFNDVNRPTFPKRAPMYVQVAIYRKDAATGTITITFGAQSQAFTLGSLNNNAWNVVILDLDKDLYHKNWKSSGALFSIAVASLATGTMYIDDVIVAPMTFVNGAWLAIVGGSTPFSRNDTFTITDTVAGRGVMSYWLLHRSGLCLAEPGFGIPVNAAGSETVTDPA